MIKLITKNTMGKVISGVLIAGVITSGSSAVFASEIKSASKNITATQQKRGDGVKIQIDALVKAGTITQTQADSVIKLFTPSEKPDADKAPKDKGADIKTKLAALVTSGTLTQTQADAIVSAMSAGRTNIKTKLDALVTAGTITQAQEDAVNKLLTPPAKPGSDSEHKDRSADIKAKLDTLVTSGTLTQTQADAILKVMTPSK